jgi:uncharacterized membrane protein
MTIIKPKHSKYIRPLVGILSLILGTAFLVIPFIPLGYILLIAGLFLLTPNIPVLKKAINKLKKKDDGGKIEKVEGKVDDAEDKMNSKIQNKQN